MSTYLQSAAALLGGLGLFMLGMWLLSDGLKAAAGTAIRSILARGTRTPPRALLAGTGLTALVQSSTAVTVATVGFVNAGLLTLTQALWVIYGSNVGTTMTSWIVAMTGVEVKLDAYALPLIGLGMILRLSGPGTRRAAWGQALAGFALFVLGIQALKTHFSALAATIDFSLLPQGGLAAILVFFGIGLVLTALIHSSSATIAIVLTAVSAGIVPAHLGALVIIGADLGTSSTAVLASVGASANARRVALSHVMFNLVTTLFATLTLSWMLQFAGWMQALLNLPSGQAMQLAVFSTLFNLVGVMLMVPLTPWLTRFLLARFQTLEESWSRPRFLDESVLDDGDVAVQAVQREVQRMGALSLELLREATGGAHSDAGGLRRRQASLVQLGDQIGVHVGRLNRASQPASERIAALLRAMQHYEAAIEMALAADTAQPPAAIWREEQRQQLSQFFQSADTSATEFHLPQLQSAMDALEQQYQQAKRSLLQAAVHGDLAVETMETEIERLARHRDLAERITKAAGRITQQ